MSKYLGGWSSRLLGRGNKSGKEADMSETFKKLGMDFIKSEDFRFRIALMNEAIDELNSGIQGNTPTTRLLSLKKRLAILNKALELGTTPYGRGGDNPEFVQMVQIWHKWCSHWAESLFVGTIAEQVESYDSISPEQLKSMHDGDTLMLELPPTLDTSDLNAKTFRLKQDTIVNQLINFIESVWIPMAWTIISKGYLGKDITPAYAAIVVGMVNPAVQQGGGSVQPIFSPFADLAPYRQQQNKEAEEQ